MIDSPIMHYVNFLIDHGRKPYTDITDNNMPGAYYTEALAMRIFGGGDVAWRVYDYVLLSGMTAVLILITLPYDWLAGLFAGGLFIAVHAAEGPRYSVEREQVLTVLLVLGYAALFAAVRRRKPFLMLLFGITGGIAASIKPTFLPLPLALMAVSAVVLHRRRIATLPYLAWSFVGLAASAALDLAYLIHYDALHEFLFLLRTVTPTYAALARTPFWRLLSLSLPLYIPALVLLAILTAILNRRSRTPWTWEHWSLALGAAFGLFSFMAQGKPFLHHRYTLLVLLFVLIGLELLSALKANGWPPALALITFAYVLFWIVPMEMREVIITGRQLPRGQVVFVLSLESDLNRLGGASALQDKVQCMDLVYGCLNTLYHLGIVENTSYTGDLLLFADRDGLAARYYRNKYWDLQRSNPASVIVLSNEWFQRKNSFDKIENWPEFASFLARNYTQVLERRFDHQGDDPRNPDGYRIYLRNSDPLLARVPALVAPSPY